MHSFTAKGGTIFHYRGDLTGETLVTLDTSKAQSGEALVHTADLIEFALHVKAEQAKREAFVRYDPITGAYSANRIPTPEQRRTLMQATAPRDLPFVFVQPDDEDE